VSLCKKFTPINATQISKFEREGRAVKILFRPRNFSFPSSFPHKRYGGYFFQYTARVIAICTVMNKNRNSKLESGAMETHFDPKDFISLLSLLFS
jgi:hypothetical protein